MTARYAIYYAPAPEAPLGAFGRRWLGRDIVTGEPVAQPAFTGFDSVRLAAITASPRHYGFHATLKPPFELLDGHDEAELLQAVDDFAANRKPVSAPKLRVASIGGFLALTPCGTSRALDHFAADCVIAFDHLRRPPCDAELEKRRARGLSSLQEALLQRWGYPYVMEEFRFHMTLTEKLEPQERDRVKALIERETADLLAAPLVIDAVSVFRQESRALPFTMVAQTKFRA